MSRLYNILRKFADVEQAPISITPSVGSLKEANAFKSGRVVHLMLLVYNTASVVPGDNVFEGTITTEGLIPKAQTSGAAYYAARPFVAVVSANGLIRVRNTGSDSFSNNDSSPLYIPFTYLA